MIDERIPAADGGFDAQHLPAFTPSASLWPRIEAAQRRRVRTRGLRMGAAGTAAVLVAALAIALLPRAPSTSNNAVVSGQRESQALEHEWQQFARAGRSAAGATTRLRLIDVALQSAYDRGADADELAVLWRQRNQALRGLIAGLHANHSDDAPALTRI